VTFGLALTIGRIVESQYSELLTLAGAPTLQCMRSVIQTYGRFGGGEWVYMLALPFKGGEDKRY